MTAEPAVQALGVEPEAPPTPGVRVVLDVRPLQDPDRSPATSAYLAGLLGAFDADPLAGESFAFLLQSDLGDPTTAYPRLDVVGRRLLPPTRLLRSGALTVDPFLLRGASLGAAWRAERGGAAGAVYHAAAGSMPLFSRIPIVVTLLDLAPWELSGAYQRSPSARFGQRLRGRLLRDAAAVVVGSTAVARAAGRLLHLRRAHLRVVPLAARPAFTPRDPGADPGHHDAATREELERLGLPDRYLVYPGRYDARQDLGTLLRALAALGASGRPRSLPAGTPWPPRVLLVGASPGDRAALARAAAREDVGDALAYAPALPPERLAALVRGARAVILPVLSEAAGLAAIEALACGTPVVASNVGALPEIVGSAGILVEPRDVDRLAAALRSAWADERVHRRLDGLALDRARGPRRTWADVAAETRRVYAEVGVRGERRGRGEPAAG
ncbi:MAG TPA: glycosyltransferase [Candidatus Limnocylindrales bacterium]|nr:glycosyltransferase [Candidatus Limnocylindrales bacterium]